MWKALTIDQFVFRVLGLVSKRVWSVTRQIPSFRCHCQSILTSEVSAGEKNKTLQILSTLKGLLTRKRESNMVYN